MAAAWNFLRKGTSKHTLRLRGGGPKAEEFTPLDPTEELSWGEILGAKYHTVLLSKPWLIFHIWQAWWSLGHQAPDDARARAVVDTVVTSPPLTIGVVLKLRGHLSEWTGDAAFNMAPPFTTTPQGALYPQPSNTAAQSSLAPSLVINAPTVCPREATDPDKVHTVVLGAPRIGRVRAFTMTGVHSAQLRYGHCTCGVRLGVSAWQAMRSAPWSCYNDAYKLQHFQSSARTIWSRELLSWQAALLERSQAAFDGLADAYAAHMDNCGYSGAGATVGEARPFDYRMAQRVFFQWNLLSLQVEFGLPLSPPLTRDTVESELLRVFPDLRAAFVHRFTVLHDTHCPDIGHTKALVLDLCAKICRDQCIAKTNGQLLVLAGKGVVNVGCPRSPSFKSPMCCEHSHRAAVAAETLTTRGKLAAPQLVLSKVGASRPTTVGVDEAFVDSLLTDVQSSFDGLHCVPTVTIASSDDMVVVRLFHCRECGQRTQKFRQSKCVGCPKKLVPIEQRCDPLLVAVDAPPPDCPDDIAQRHARIVSRVVNGESTAYHLRDRASARAEQE